MKSTVGGGHRGVGGTEGCLAVLRGAGQAGWGIRMGHSGSAAPHRAGMDPQALLGLLIRATHRPVICFQGIMFSCFF